MNRIIRHSATAIAAATLGLGALTTSFAGAASAAEVGCKTTFCPPAHDHSPGQGKIPQFDKPKPPKPNWIPGNNDPRAYQNPGGPLPR